MRTLEQAIEHAECIVNNRKDAISVCWSVKDCEQLAAWLRELQERRKEPEIVHCGECKFYQTRAKNDYLPMCCFSNLLREPDNYCNFAERRTDADD